MSNNLARVREAHGGKFTRPKDQWKGRRRATGRGSQRGGALDAGGLNQMFSSLAKNFAAPKGNSVFATSMAKFLKGKGQRGA